MPQSIQVQNANMSALWKVINFPFTGILNIFSGSVLSRAAGIRWEPSCAISCLIIQTSAMTTTAIPILQTRQTGPRVKLGFYKVFVSSEPELPLCLLSMPWRWVEVTGTSMALEFQFSLCCFYRWHIHPSPLSPIKTSISSIYKMQILSHDLTNHQSPF